MKKIYLLAAILLVASIAYSYTLTITVTSNAPGTAHIWVTGETYDINLYRSLSSGDNIFYVYNLDNQTGHTTYIDAVGVNNCEEDSDSDTSTYADPNADLEVDIDGEYPQNPPPND